jgi:hypothetical protein
MLLRVAQDATRRYYVDKFGADGKIFGRVRGETLKKKNMASEKLVEKLMEYGEQKRLAEKLGANASRVCLWANRKAKIPNRYLAKINDIYGFVAVDGGEK